MKKLLNVPTIILLVAAIVLYGEYIYIKSSPHKLKDYGIRMAYFHNRIGPRSSLNTIVKFANAAAKLNDKKYEGELFKFTLNPNILEANSAFFFGYVPYINKIYKLRAYMFDDYDFSRILYETSLIAYFSLNEELFENLMKLAISIDPTLSFWQVELANFYFESGETELGFEVLDACQKLPEPEHHCRNYEEYIKLSGEALEVGFLMPETNKFYAISSLLDERYYR